MLTLKRLAIYLATFLIVVSFAIGIADWKRLDTYLVSTVNRSDSIQNSLNKKIIVINLEKNVSGSEGASLRMFRQHLIKFLNTIVARAKEKEAPSGVVLDIWFSRDTTELGGLQATLQQLKVLHVPVYAVYNINESHQYKNIEDIDFDDVETKHEIGLYNKYFAGSDGKLPGSGRYHTFFYPGKDVVNYENDIRLSSGMFDSVLIESLARKVYSDLTDSKPLPKREGSVIPVRSSEEINAKTYTFIPDSALSTGIFQSMAGNDIPVDFDGNILIVGDVDHDVLNIGDKTIPGPYIFSWALSDLLGNNSNLKLPVESRYLIIGQILFCSFFAVLIYAVLFKYVRRLQTLPLVIAVLAFIAGAFFLFIYGKLILEFNSVVPVGHTLVAMLVACLLSWRFAYKFLVTGVAEGSQKYDVFISYSRSESEWVEKFVYEPLLAYRKPDGSKLSIFFDKRSIGIGEAFTSKYMWAIVDTKNFIAVLSEDYYSKNHCRNELDCAVKRKVEKLLNLQMIAFSDEAVPEAYNSFNYLEKNRIPAFIKTIEEQLSV